MLLIWKNLVSAYALHAATQKYPGLLPQAMEAIEELRQAVDALIIIPNDKLLQSKTLQDYIRFMSRQLQEQTQGLHSGALGTIQ